ncbi:MAG TPA: hypothetical protein VIV60_30640, partial [Polyangiaceae bacterium]
PRRQSSYPDDGDHRMLPGSIAPLRTPQLLQVQPVQTHESRAVETVEVAAVEAKDPLSVTEVVVTRTRPSLLPVKLGLQWGYTRLKAFPKRPLVLVAVGAGIVLGALITFAASSRSHRIEALSPEPNNSAQPPLLLGSSSSVPTVTPVNPDPQVDVLPILPPQPDDLRHPEPQPRRSVGTPQSAPKKQNGTPDYGI